ncbi:MAG: hypothetical protein QN120_14420 [Armatimonadota bacterium]|nr:hypothetical protein [Armatimonadota bacterium]
MEKRESVERGIGVVRTYLEEQFPDLGVAVLDVSSTDFDRDIRRFRVGNAPGHLLRVSEEFLNLDPAEIERCLRQWPVAQALRRAGHAQAIVITTEGIKAEAI